MEKYTGKEHNLALSRESQNVAAWENMRALPKDSGTTKLVSQYVKSICTRLYQKKGGEYAKPDFFDKNFRIVVEDSPEIQASHIHRKHSNDNRTILTVSKGLLQNVQSEAQLAFVLAHELGHFEVEETRDADLFGEAVSKHEHEIQADYRGMKSLVEAGYNPDEAIRFFEMINEQTPDIKSAYETANNEHGSTSTRLANIRDYKSAFEREGIQFSTDTGQDRFEDFQKEFIQAAQNDHCISYFEERIRQEYGVSSSRQLSQQDRWNFCERIITEEPQTLLDGGPQRVSEFDRILSENVLAVTKENAIQINRIMQKCYDFNCTHRISPNEMWCGLKFPVYDVDGDFYIKPLGSLAKKIEEMQNLINNREAWTALREPLKAYNYRYMLENIYPMEDHVLKPAFSVQGLQKGDTVPWAAGSEAVNVQNYKDIQEIMAALNVQYDYFEQKYGDSLGHPFGEESSIYCNAQGVVISTAPEEVSKLRTECHEKVKSLSFDEQKRQMLLNFHDQLVLMAQNERGSEAFKQAKQRAGEIYLQSQTAFADFDNTHDFLLKDTDLTLKNDDINRPTGQLFRQEIENGGGEYHIYRSLNSKYIQEFYPFYTEVVLAAELKDIRNVYHSERYPKVDKALEFVNNQYNNLLNKDRIPAEVCHEVIQKMAPSVLKVYSDMMGDTPKKSSIRYLNRIVTQTLLNENVGANGNLPAIEALRKVQGISDAHNTAELIANLEAMKSAPGKEAYISTTVGYTKLLYDYEVMRTINQGSDIDVEAVLNVMPGTVAPDLANKMTDYVLKKRLFDAREGETAEQTYERCKKLYVTMSAKEAFTQTNDTQRKIETMLLGYMQNLPPEKRFEEARALLNTNIDNDLANKELTSGNEFAIQCERLKELGGSILQYDGNTQVAEKLIAASIIRQYGPDDKSAQYRESINTKLENIAANMPLKSRKRICRQVAKGIMAQKELAYDIKAIHDREISNNYAKGEAARGYNMLDTYLTRNPKFAEKTMVFLLSDGNAEDCRRFSEELAQEYNQNRSLIPDEWKRKMDRKLKENNVQGISSSDIEKLTIPEDSFVASVGQLHEEYLNAEFEERAVIMHRLLDSYANEPELNEEQKLQKQISFVSDKIFGSREEDRDLLNEVKTISAAICHQEEQPSLLLGGVLSGREPGQSDDSMNVGDGLAMFCEKQGTAWVKLAQTLSYVDALPQDVRNSLGRLKDKANEPSQWDIYKDLEEAMPESELARIQHVQKFIGGGTFNKTILVDVQNTETGKSETKVVQVMHDRAATKSEREFKKINAAIDELCAADPKYEILKSVAERSAKNARLEVDINAGAQQYRNACENYGKIESIELNNVTYIPKVATWERYGESRYSNYKIMEMAPGKSIDSPDFTPAQRREMALAYTSIELANLLGGKAWDIDRHSKQQNFHVTRDKNGKVVVEIGIFDTGAQRPQPTREEKKLLGKFLISVIKEQQTGNGANLGEFMLEKIKKFEKAGKDVNYVSDVQRGLLAISDVMQYMNTPENPNGVTDGLMTCFTVLRENKIIDNGLYKALKREIAKAALKSPAFGQKVLDTVIHPQESKDKLLINLSTNDDRARQQIEASVQADKPAYETDQIELEKTRIKPKPLTPEEQVAKELSELGVPKESYLLLTPDDKYLKTGYEQEEGISIERYFNRQEEAQKYGAEKLLGCNNGMTAVYFAKQNIYVVSPGNALKLAMQRTASCKDVGYGVMFSNGEAFTNSISKNNEFKKIRAFVEEQKNSAVQSRPPAASINSAAGTTALSEEEKKRLFLEKSGRLRMAQVSSSHREETTVTAERPTALSNTDQPNSKNMAEITQVQTETSGKEISGMKKKAKTSFMQALRLGRNFLLDRGKSKTQTAEASKEHTQATAKKPNVFGRLFKSNSASR